MNDPVSYDDDGGTPSEESDDEEYYYSRDSPTRTGTSRDPNHDDDDTVTRLMPGRAVPRARGGVLGGSQMLGVHGGPAGTHHHRGGSGGGDSARGRPNAGGIQLGASAGSLFPELAAAAAKQARRPRRNEGFWKYYTYCMGMLTVSLAILLAIWTVYCQYYQPCNIFLQQIQVTRLPEKRYYFSEHIDFALDLSINNPNRASAEVSHAYLRFAIIDDMRNRTYNVHEPIRYPGNVTKVIPSDSTRMVRLPVSVKISSLAEGLRVVVLAHGGCFSLQVTGEITYTVGNSPHTTKINRYQMLFGSPQACPSCGVT